VPLSDVFNSDYCCRCCYWLQRASPDERPPVQFVDNVELAYIMRRYREIHDLVHVVLGQPTNMLGEVTVKMFEGLQTGLFMCATGGILGAVRLGRRLDNIVYQYSRFNA